MVYTIQRKYIFYVYVYENQTSQSTIQSIYFVKHLQKTPDSTTLTGYNTVHNFSQTPSGTLDSSSLTGNSTLHIFRQTSVEKTQLPLGTIQCILLVRPLSKISSPVHSQGTIQCILLVRSLSKSLDYPTLIGYNIQCILIVRPLSTLDLFTLIMCNISACFYSDIYQKHLPNYSHWVQWSAYI